MLLKKNKKLKNVKKLAQMSFNPNFCFFFFLFDLILTTLFCSPDIKLCSKYDPESGKTPCSTELREKVQRT